MTLAPRWRKVLRDVAVHPARSAIAVLAMAAGTFGIGVILTAYAILDRELARTHADTHPASALLYAYGVTDAAVAAARRVTGVRDAEARPVVRGRIRVAPDEWRPLVLFVVRDFDAQRIDTFRRDSGAWPPGPDDVVVERSSMPVARARVGDRVVVRAAGAERSLRLAGTVHAAGLAPGWMDHVVSGFVPWSSVARRDPASEVSELRIVVTERPCDEAHVHAVAARVEAELVRAGHRVVGVEVLDPGRHPHADQMDTFLFLLGAFGVLALVLGSVLVATMIHAILVEQTRQVGIMKAIGASTRQIAALYLGQVAGLAALALVIGMPLAHQAGLAYTRFSAGILNATIASTAVPWWSIAAQVAVGMLMPLLVALGPVVRAARISIHEALGAEIGRRAFGTRRFDRWLARIRWLPRPLMLSLRGSFHRPGRLALTVGTLAAGGAVFVSALNVSAAWNRALDAESRARRYDVDVRFPAGVPEADVAAALRAVEEVADVAFWPETGALLVGAPDRPGRLRMHGGSGDRVSVVGPEVPSPLLALPLIEGRWLTPADRGVAVVNQAVLARDPALGVGGTLRLQIDDHEVTWRIVGVVKELAPVVRAYAQDADVRAAAGLAPGTTRSARIVTRSHGLGDVTRAARGIERALERAGIGVAHVQTLADTRKAFADHLVIIQTALLLAAGLVVLVGALGLTSTLTLNVVERTREIGILGAIGATPRTIAAHVVFEGLLLGVMSGGVAIAAAAAITAVLDRVSGEMFIRSGLPFFMSPGACAIWLSLVLVLAALGSFYPGSRAARLAVREALAYE